VPLSIGIGEMPLLSKYWGNTAVIKILDNATVKILGNIVFVNILGKCRCYEYGGENVAVIKILGTLGEIPQL
jgi:hypothetical protein